MTGPPLRLLPTNLRCQLGVAPGALSMTSMPTIIVIISRNSDILGSSSLRVVLAIPATLLQPRKLSSLHA